ncbi:MAG: hypothetical protein [Caudoviricetes sp.]|nr:MAG: hypothetical protein [Caudoviricetes sp.]
MDDYITVMVLGSPKLGEREFEHLCSVLQDYTADQRYYGNYYRYRIIQTGEAGGIAAMARKFALDYERLSVGEQHKDYLIKDWLADEHRMSVDLCIAYMAGDSSDNATWRLLKQIVNVGMDEIRIY